MATNVKLNVKILRGRTDFGARFSEFKALLVLAASADRFTKVARRLSDDVLRKPVKFLAFDFRSTGRARYICRCKFNELFLHRLAALRAFERKLLAVHDVPHLKEQHRSRSARAR